MHDMPVAAHNLEAWDGKNVYHICLCARHKTYRGRGGTVPRNIYLGAMMEMIG